MKTKSMFDLYQIGLDPRIDYIYSTIKLRLIVEKLIFYNSVTKI